jgi:hypothetical protein
MSTVQIIKNKIWYNINDTQSHFACKVSVNTIGELQKLLADCIKGRISPDFWDWGSFPLDEVYYKYKIKGWCRPIRRSRVIPVALELALFKNEIKNRKDVTIILGFKSYCKSVDKILKSLPLPSVAMLYNKLRKEITYGKTSGSDKT